MIDVKRVLQKCEMFCLFVYGRTETHSCLHSHHEICLLLSLSTFLSLFLSLFGSHHLYIPISFIIFFSLIILSRSCHNIVFLSFSHYSLFLCYLYIYFFVLLFFFPFFFTLPIFLCLSAIFSLKK